MRAPSLDRYGCELTLKQQMLFEPELVLSLFLSEAIRGEQSARHRRR
jgi:hypothetical protein